MKLSILALLTLTLTSPAWAGPFVCEGPLAASEGLMATGLCQHVAVDSRGVLVQKPGQGDYPYVPREVDCNQVPRPMVPKCGYTGP